MAGGLSALATHSPHLLSRGLGASLLLQLHHAPNRTLLPPGKHVFLQYRLSQWLTLRPSYRSVRMWESASVSPPDTVPLGHRCCQPSLTLLPTPTARVQTHRLPADAAGAAQPAPPTSPWFQGVSPTLVPE